MSHQYNVTWVTNSIAAGRAPMSYEELDRVTELGITVIINLCGEFSDLHLLEEQAGFEVLWVPIADEAAPTMEEMEKGLEWLDEAVYLGKKVLVHCHHGIGRTGTFITAYLIRRGFGLKNAEKMLKYTRAIPTNFSQWWLLRKFGKKEGQLKYTAPFLDNRDTSNLEKFFSRYERILEKYAATQAADKDSTSALCCSGRKPSSQCRELVALEFIEALYLNHKVNVALTAQQRQSVIEKASPPTSLSKQPAAETGHDCPLRLDDRCLLHRFRPLHCRQDVHSRSADASAQAQKELAQLSQDAYIDLFGQPPDNTLPPVSRRDTVSGKFIQKYFEFLTSQKKTYE